MKINMQRNFRGLVPLTDKDKEKINKIPLDTSFEFEVRVPRNLKFHRKLFKMLTLVFENQDEFKNFNIFREAIIIGAGYFDRVQRLHGEEVILAKSISFANMDEEAFQHLYNDCIDTAMNYFNFSKKSFEQELANFY
jgi:hypothetical protein